MRLEDLKEAGAWMSEFHGDFGAVDHLKSGAVNLEGCPRIIHGEFYVEGDDFDDKGVDLSTIVSLKGGPEEVHGDFQISKTGITSLEGAPKVIDGRISVSKVR